MRHANADKFKRHYPKIAPPVTFTVTFDFLVYVTVGRLKRNWNESETPPSYLN